LHPRHATEDNTLRISIRDVENLSPNPNNEVCPLIHDPTSQMDSGSGSLHIGGPYLLEKGGGIPQLVRQMEV